MIFTAKKGNINSIDYLNKLVYLDKISFMNNYFNLISSDEIKNRYNNIKDEEEKSTKFMKDFYKEVLSKLNPRIVAMELDKKILVSDEDENSLSYRLLIALWLELFLGNNVMEINMNNEGQVNVFNRNNDLKMQFEKIIKDNIDMHGYNSLEAVYFYNEANELENNIRKYFKTHGYDEYHAYAYIEVASLRILADEKEEKYLISKKMAYKNK